MSALKKYFKIALYISSAVITFIKLIELFKIFNDVGPDIKVTFAPRFVAASANEKPILPDEKLPINLTGSIFS